MAKDFPHFLVPLHRENAGDIYTMEGFIKTLNRRILDSSGRTKTALKNIALSVIGKLICAVSPIIIVPMTINYVNPTQYGIWLTVCSIVSWIEILDLGLDNGFRNKFTEAVSVGNDRLAKEYVSTTYYIITLIMVMACVILNVTNEFIDWAAVLHVDAHYKEELRCVVGILLSLTCVYMIVKIVVTFLTAIQKVGAASILRGCGKLLTLLAIFILTKTTKGSILNLALYYSTIPCLLMVVVTLYLFVFSKYRKYAPGIKTVNRSLIRNILNLGVQFFMMHISMILIFQVINIVLSRELGPGAVTQYNIANRYFGIIVSAMMLIETPYWSAFTEAYTQKDFKWMRSSLRMLEYICGAFVLVGVIMLAVSGYLYKIWVGNTVVIPFFLSVGMLVMMVCQSLSTVYMYLINGIGKVRIQTLVYVSFAVFSYPILVFSCRSMGIIGALIIPSLTYLVLSVLGKVQLNKILSSSAKGIWNK